MAAEYLEFSDLIEECKLALKEYFQCETFSETEDRLKGVIFCFEWVPVEEAKRICMNESEDLWGCETFEEYHELYLASQDIPNHGSSKWACIAPGMDEWLEDGWHRFHSYVKAGDSHIPVLMFV